MIIDVPTADDFFISGKELLDFAWDNISELIRNFDQAEEFGSDPDEIKSEYWNAAKRRLSTALSITQQGVELILKGKIAEISPYILISDTPQKWPSSYKQRAIKFSEFRTIDAQDLVRTLDTFSSSLLNDSFIERFNSLREQRNSIMHSVDNSINIHVVEVIDAILYMHKFFFPEETWGQVRLNFLNQSPESILSYESFDYNLVCWELSLVFKLLEPAKIKKYFNINKNNRMYFCPKCYDSYNRDAGDPIYKLASLSPKSPSSINLYCPVCNKTYVVSREKCDETNCLGNVYSEEYNICLTCGHQKF